MAHRAGELQVRGRLSDAASADRSRRVRRSPQTQTQPMARAGLPATRAWAGTGWVTTDPAPTIAYAPTSQPATTTAPAPIDAPRAMLIGVTVQSVGAGKAAVGVLGPRAAVVGQDRAGADEDAVRDGHAVIDERAVLDLDPVAERDALIDEDVTTDHRVAADPGAGPELGAMPDARPGPDADVGLDVRRRMDARGRVDHGVAPPGFRSAGIHACIAAPRI